jgi:hypothetical protein
MTDLLCRLFVKDAGNVKNPRVRSAYGTLSSVVGILRFRQEEQSA